MMDRILRSTSFFLLCVLTFSSVELCAQDGQKILEAAETIRNPTEDYTVDVMLTDNKAGKIDERTYQVYIKGRDKALVRFLTPATEVGQFVLMVDADMWAKSPNSKKAVRVSPQQKMSGNAAYGDVARLTFIGNYTAKVLRDDKFKDEAGASRDAVVLELRSIEDRPVTYDIVEYWVEKKTNKPLLTIYKTNSGKPIREGTYGEYEGVLGVQRPTKFVLKNLLVENHVTTIRYKNAVKKTHPDMLFEKQNLGNN